MEYDTEAGVVIQDLVQLLHERRDEKQVPPLRLPRIMDIRFRSPSEILSLLGCQFVVAFPGPRAGAELPVSDPRAGDVSQTERVEDEEKIKPEEPAVEPVGEVHEEPEPQELAPASDEPAPIREHEATEREISAVKKIQATYRLYRQRHDSRARAIGGLRAQQNTIFMACLKNVLDSKWGKNPYRTLYLWALPRLLVCVDEAVVIAQGVKKKTKSLLLKESHERLEELGNQTTTMK